MPKYKWQLNSEREREREREREKEEEIVYGKWESLRDNVCSHTAISLSWLTNIDNLRHVRQSYNKKKTVRRREIEC